MVVLAFDCGIGLINNYFTYNVVNKKNTRNTVYFFLNFLLLILSIITGCLTNILIEEYQCFYCLIDSIDWFKNVN
jgi:hypothetical protein